MASSGWYAGVVKEVQSGDTLVVAGASTNNGIAAERRISLSSLSAPRMVRELLPATRDTPSARTAELMSRNLAH